MATTTQINSRIESAVTKAEKTQEAYLKVLSSEGQQDIKLSDGTFTPNLNKRLADHVNRVKSVAGKTGDVTAQDIKDSLSLGSAAYYNVNDLPVPQGVDGRIQTAINNLNLGSASQKNVEFFAEQEKQADKVILGNGRDVESKLSDNPNPIDFGAKGDGVTDDTQAFTDFEKSVQGREIDLLGKTYLVTRDFIKNNYKNGYFKKLSSGTSYSTFVSDKSEKYSTEYRENNDGGFLYKSLLVDSSSSTGGRILQSFAYDFYDDKFFALKGYDANTSTEQMVIERYDIHSESSEVIKASTSLPTNQIGHQGFAVQRIRNGGRWFWATSGSDMNKDGRYFVKFKYNTEGGGLTELAKYKLFDDRFRTLNDTKLIAISPNGKLIAVYGVEDSTANRVVRVFDTSQFNYATDGDFSDKYLYEFPLARPYGKTTAGLAIDGDFVYFMGSSAVSTTDRSEIVSATQHMQVYTIDGRLLVNDSFMRIGLGTAINQGDLVSEYMYEPESVGFININGIPTLTILGASAAKDGDYRYNNLHTVNKFSVPSLSVDKFKNSSVYSPVSNYTVIEQNSGRTLFQSSLSSNILKLSVKNTLNYPSMVAVENPKRNVSLQVTATGLFSLYDHTYGKAFITSNASGTLTTLENKTYVNSDFSFKPSTSVTPSNNGDLTFESTSNTSVTVKLKGSDGVVRSAILNLT